MKVNRIRQNVFPVLAALIWGTAFVAQSVGADYVEPFTFNAARGVGGLCVSAGAVSGVPRPAAAGFSGGGPGPARLPAGSGPGRHLLRRGPDSGHQPPADGAGDHHLRQGGIHHGAVYCHCAHCGAFSSGKRRPGPIWLSVALAVVGLYLPVHAGVLLHHGGGLLRAAVLLLLLRPTSWSSTTLPRRWTVWPCPAYSSWW